MPQAAANPGPVQIREDVKPDTTSAPIEEIRPIAAAPPEKPSNSYAIAGAASFFLIAAIYAVMERRRSRKKESKPENQAGGTEALEKKVEY